ncbi:MAG: hypothetical protein ACUVRM_11090 [Bacillota bacterium]
MEKRFRSAYFLSLALLVLAVLFWGFSFISTKIVLAEEPRRALPSGGKSSPRRS